MAKQFPGVPNLGDITRIEQAPPVDILCGGFPCQDISLAGKGAGIGGARSGLWKEYARIIETQKPRKPRYVVIENVSALRSRGLDVVLQDLCALGYDAEWHCIPAAAVGAPHRRDRIWIVAYPHSDDAGLEGWLGASVEKRAGQWPVRSVGSFMADASHELLHGTGCTETGGRDEHSDGREDVADAGRFAAQPHGAVGEVGRPSREDEGAREERERLRDAVDGGSTIIRAEDWWLAEPDVGRVANGIPSRVDRLRCLGNAVVPQVTEWIGRRIVLATIEQICDRASIARCNKPAI
jgi:DNA (cytosine-5)-methyltransferase 1